MRRPGPRTWITLSSLVAVVLMAVVDVERASPGPIASVHARLEAVAGGASCAACHGGWFVSMTDACLECHAPIADEIEAGAGLHGRLQESLAGQCATCHSEHHGAGFALVNRRTFAAAGVPDPTAFDHARVGFDMSGRHLEIGCVECHENARVAVLDEGMPRFRGLDQACESCHEDPHKGRMQVSCVTCHGQSRWEELHSTGHDRFLPLVGGHGDVACRTCHAEGSPHELERMGESEYEPDVRTCVDCHASPHQDGFAAFAARAAGLETARGCVLCHAAEHTTFRQGAELVGVAQHAAAGFPLDRPHDAVRCEQCHDTNGEFRARHPGRSPDACSVCHADPHGGQFAAGPFAGQECTACHARLAFEPPAFGPDEHARAFLPLDGAHLDVRCEACHVDPPAGEPRAFHGTPGRCADCHPDAHAGFFDQRAADQPAPKHGACALCHTTAGFAQVGEQRFDHGAWTGFPVRGAHQNDGCASCHPSATEPDATARTFGRVAQRFGPFTGCVTCHADPHEGRFDAPDLPADVGGLEGCARCHVETSFRSFPHEFEHGLWTGFALSGGHAETACSGCHASLRTPDARGRTWGPANGTSCADCHPDPHGGQFDEEGPADCARCHDSAPADYVVFDHERDARFPLGEQHRGLDCSACHRPATLPSGVEAVVYRPLGIECADCHGVRADVLTRRRRK